MPFGKTDLEGELETTLADDRNFLPRPGMSWQVGDGAEPHGSRTETGIRFFIVE